MDDECAAYAHLWIGRVEGSGSAFRQGLGLGQELAFRHLKQHEGGRMGQTDEQ
jgi:hypothetical protein